MKFYYDSDGSINWVNDLRLPLPYPGMPYGSNWNYNSLNYYSEVSAAIDGNCVLNEPPFWPEYQDSLNMLRDWSGYKVLKLSYYGDPCNTIVATDKLYIGLLDSDGTLSIVTNPDQTYIQRLGWHDWYIPLSAFSPSLNLGDVNRIYIGIGNRTTPATGGKGALFFDDIRLYPESVCIPGSVVGDFTCDCIVNYEDLEVMRDEWLIAGIADINLDGIVDFKDFALFANNWMVGPILFP